MPILLWYLPYTMFSGACDLVMSEFEMQAAGDWAAEPAERRQDSDEPAQWHRRSPGFDGSKSPPVRGSLPVCQDDRPAFTTRRCQIGDSRF
jgi:hypothetical protein